MLRLTFATLVVVAISALDNSQAVDQTSLFVGFQAAMSRQFLLSYEKIQIAQHFSTAGTTFAYVLTQGNNSPAKAFEEEESAEEDSDDQSFLQFENDLEEEVATLKPSQSTAKQSLLSVYELFSGIKRWLHVTVFTAGDVQNAFWTDRAIQMSLQGFAGQLSPQHAQFLYLKNFRTQLQTLKFANQLQTISHFTTWLEDEIDIGSELANPTSTVAMALLEASADDLIASKLQAFQAYSSYAQIDMYVMYIDMYLNQILASLQNAPSPSNATSFLETESEFLPLMMMGGLGGGQMGPWIGYYRTMLQVQAAQAGLTSAMAESVARKKLNDKDTSNDKDGEASLVFARQSFASFGQTLAQMSQVDMWLGMMGLYQVYGVMAQQQQPANANAA